MLLILAEDEETCTEIASLLVYAKDVQSSMKSASDALKCFLSNAERTISFQNRYYSSQVPIECISLSGMKEKSDLKNVDACIVVNPENLKEVEECLDDLEISTRLMVQMSDDPDAADDNREASLALMWCLDNGFELIPVSRKSPFQTWGEREKEHIPRVLEALESTLWSTMEKHAPSTHTDTQQGAAQSTEDESAPSSVSTGAGALAADASCSTGERRQDEPEAREKDFERLYSFLQKGQDREGDDDEGAGDTGENDAIFSFIDEARRVREAALSGNMTDEERRANAAKAAERLAALMFAGDEDEDEGEDGDEKDQSITPVVARVV